MREVEVYVKNENDANSVQAELNKFRVKNVTSEKMGEGNKSGFFFPFFSSSKDDSSGGIPSFTTGDSGDSSEERKAKKADPKYMSHLLRFEVSEEDYDEAMSALRKYDVYGLDSDNNK